MNRFELQNKRDKIQFKSDKIEQLMNNISELYKENNPDIIVIYGLISKTEQLIDELLKDSEQADTIQQVVILQNVSVLKSEYNRLSDYALVIKNKNKAEAVSNQIQNTTNLINFKNKLKESL